MARLTYSVLGGLGAQIDSETVELGTRKQRAVLAQLILADGPVSTDRLIDGLWGRRPPTARKSRYRPTSPDCARCWSRAGNPAHPRRSW
ncbi:hypothetical protein [Gordonia sp. SID5947]|uniref:AfsR/SARP family transcriptional regulator n=1 Tax=Gordonia sp. SID5947 TaxID=2690315 RepID=UPI001F4654D0|nr:hypothetical protein [Gordonia sp. SID5947]